MGPALKARPISLRDANLVVEEWHSHHRPVRGHKFSIGAFNEDKCVGVVIVSRPVAQGLQNGTTLEVTRLCTQGFKNAASFLLARAWRASRAMGAERLVSYTRHNELGTSYRAAGWKACADVKGREWTSGNKNGRWLPGMYEPSSEVVDRVRWEVRVTWDQ